MKTNNLRNRISSWLRNLAEKIKTPDEPVICYERYRIDRLRCSYQVSDVSYGNHILNLEASYGLSHAEAIKRTDEKCIQIVKDEILKSLPETLEKKGCIVWRTDYTDSGLPIVSMELIVGVDMNNEKPFE